MPSVASCCSSPSSSLHHYQIITKSLLSAAYGSVLVNRRMGPARGRYTGLGASSTSPRYQHVQDVWENIFFTSKFYLNFNVKTYPNKGLTKDQKGSLDSNCTQTLPILMIMNETSNSFLFFALPQFFLQFSLHFFSQFLT